MSLTSKTLPLRNRLIPVVQRLTQIRWSSFKSSPFIEDLSETGRQYEVSKDPVEWEYVSRLLPPTTVPEPVKKDFYPSGWKPQANDLTDRPYFIARTRNHMIPCYLNISNLKVKKTTVLKNIKGDIWLLEKEIKEFLTPQFFQPIRSQVNEFAGFIRINGDYVNAVKHFLEQKGF